VANNKITMLSYFDLRKGTQFILEGQPYEVLEFHQIKKGRGSATVQVKIRNLINGTVLERTFHQGENFEEAELQKIEIKFLYSHVIRKPLASNEASCRKFCFSEIQNPKNRFELSEEQIGSNAKFLKENQILTAILFENKIINIVLPIKINLKVIEAPIGLKGNRVQAGTKTVVLETGAKINVPLFIKEGDIIEINTETEEYTRRIE